MLPRSFAVDGSLADEGNARAVVEALHAAAGQAPALKLDLTTTQATLTVLEDGAPRSVRWSADVIDEATTDFEYFDQRTFDPRGFPLDQVGLMFDLADLLGVRGDLVYQVQEYREQQVFQTVSSRPESFTVFFERDASAVPVLGTATTADIAEGMREVITNDIAIREFGFSPERGYWVVSTTADGEVMRVRKDGIPMFEAPSGTILDGEAFSVRTLSAPAMAATMDRLRSNPEDPCSVRVVWSDALHQPTMTVDCGGNVDEVRLDGTPLP